MKKLDIDRDASVDRLLRESLAPPAATSPGVCLDAETLAAWADGTLGRGARAVVETHAADCGRCQALLAAMVRTAPPAPAWRMPSLRWLVPLTVAATAALFFTLVPARSPLEQHGREAPAASQVVAPPTSAPANAPTPAAPASAIETDARSRRDASAIPKDSIIGGRRAEQPTSSLDKSEKAAAPAELKAKTLDENVIVSGAIDKPSASPTTAPALPPPAQAAAAPSSTRNLAMARAFTPTIVIVSPDAASQWRIIEEGAVQRSTDRGATWETQQTGATVAFAAGASPASSVCWLVGPGGTIRLSTDGRTWQPVPFPEPARLTAVTATDDKTVTVTTGDGRRYTSADRGATWSRIP